MDELQICYKKWFQSAGREFFEACGLKQGSTVLEFGAGGGNYTAVLSQAVGSAGKVYALESKHEIYADLKEKLKNYALENVTIHDTKGEINLDLGLQFDFALVYDVAHYFEQENRKKLYSAIFGNLNKGGIFSLYPKHALGDAVPQGEFGKMNEDEIKKEVVDCGFSFQQKICAEIVHNNAFAQDCVLNFQK